MHPGDQITDLWEKGREGRKKGGGRRRVFNSYTNVDLRNSSWLSYLLLLKDSVFYKQKPVMVVCTVNHITEPHKGNSI